MNKVRFACLLFLLLLSFTELKAQNCSTDTVQFTSQVQVFTSVPIGILADRLNRPYVYMAGKEGGLLIYDVNNIQSPQLANTLTQYFFDSLDVMYLVQDSIYLYVALGNFFGTVPEKPGMAILDISVPANPSLIGIWKWTSVTKGASTVLVNGNFAYLAAMNQGVFILNISNKSSIQLESNYVPDLNWPVVNPNPVQEPNARGMAYRNDTLFLCYDAGGLRVLDVSNKTAPQQIAQYLNPGALNKQQAFNHIILDGGLAYIAQDYCGLEVVDISNISSISQVGWWNPWGCEIPANQWNGSPGHTNQMVYDAGLKIIYLSSGDSELRIVDVANPAFPDSCNGWGPTGNIKACWGTDVYGPNIFMTYINAFVPYHSNWAGFKVLSWPLISGMEEEGSVLPAPQLFPNPALDEVTVTFGESDFCPADIRFYNLLGVCCLRKKIRSGEKINLGTIQAGIYTILVENGKAQPPLKLVRY